MTRLCHLGTAALGTDTLNNFSATRLEQSRANLITAELPGPGFPTLDTDALRKVNIPTLLISGGASPRLYHYLLERLQELLPHSERIEIPGAAHIMSVLFTLPITLCCASLSLWLDEPGKACNQPVPSRSQIPRICQRLY